MCGIYGVIDPKFSVDENLIKFRRDFLSHRGPDGAGLWISEDKHVGLAHRRLAILDLSENGHQPMISKNNRYTISYNGEVYNFLELRSELEKLGYTFKGGSDTEVVLAAYQEWGKASLNRFNGMFSIAIYDRGDAHHPAQLILATDRAGKKSIYYTFQNGKFQFASELKALDTVKEVDARALNFYFAVGYIPADLSLYGEIKKVPPASVMTIDVSTLKSKSEVYWKLPENKPLSGITSEEITDQVEKLFLDSVQKRMISDVPLGILLSGGLDSGLIASAAARQSSKPIKTFTISFPGSQYDEAAYASELASKLGTEHHVLEVRLPSLKSLEEIAPFVDEPIADSSLIPSYLVTKMTRQHVTVALGGDGGDELFGGYTDYPISLADQERFGWIPQPLLQRAAEMIAMFPAGIRGRNRISSLRGGPLKQMVWGTPYFDPELRKRIFTDDQLKSLGDDLLAPERWLLSLFNQGKDPVDCMTRTHFGSILPGDFLVKVDRASMMNSLEVRCPFLDYRLIEYAFGQIPSEWKVKDGETRRIERLLAKRLLPGNMTNHRKQGFSIPMDDYLRADNGAMLREFSQYLPESINKNEMNSLIEGHQKGRANGARLYSLLMLSLAMKNRK